MHQRSTNFARFVLYFVKIVHSKDHYQGLVASKVFYITTFISLSYLFFVFILVSFRFFFNKTHCVLMMLCLLAFLRIGAPMLPTFANIAKLQQHLPTLPSSDNICHFLLLNFANVSYLLWSCVNCHQCQPQMNFIIHRHCQAPTKCYTLIPCPPSCLALPLLDYLVYLE